MVLDEEEVPPSGEDIEEGNEGEDLKNPPKKRSILTKSKSSNTGNGGSRRRKTDEPSN